MPDVDWLLTEMPTSATDAVATSQQQRCTSAGSMLASHIGNLTAKHGALTISGTKQRLMVTDSNLPLSGISAVQGSILFQDAAGLRIGCASFDANQTRNAVVNVNMNGMSGSIRFSQAHPDADTEIEVDVTGLDGRVGGWHVHELPLPSGEDAGALGPAQCSSAGTGGHFDPYQTGVCDDANYTTDECEIGDLSGKHGSWADLTSVEDTYTDGNLPLFGSNSIVGRSVVFHHKVTGERIACGTIEPEGAVKTVVARFSGSVQGFVRLQQLADDPLAPTTVLVGLSYQAVNAAPTVNHNWHVHVSPVTSDCASTGGHYNPYDLCLDSTCGYSSTCGEDGEQQYNCEVGDVAGKGGPLSLGAAVAGQAAPRVMYTDLQLPLSGPESVADRSVVLHAADFGGARLACASFEDVITSTTLEPPLSSASCAHFGFSILFALSMLFQIFA
eukprot:TRINITY_DN9827_c0_g2_i1.p1 TRINITY_DN9827_c0_g2~~TRINITY_DN9827_c0_g2_i1.p1  ORF type:complete len:508 (+),score=123.09 TRINITY_DN9827_c0_g2_i1:195-1526(+)